MRSRTWWWQLRNASNFTDWVRLRRGEFDALLVHGVWQYNSFGVWRGTRHSETPYFVFPHGMLTHGFEKPIRSSI